MTNIHREAVNLPTEFINDLYVISGSTDQILTWLGV